MQWLEIQLKVNQAKLKRYFLGPCIIWPSDVIIVSQGH